MIKIPIFFIAIFIHYRFQYSTSKRRHTYKDAHSLFNLCFNHNLTIQEWICAIQFIDRFSLCTHKIYYLLSSLLSITCDIPDTIHDVFNKWNEIFGGTEPKVYAFFAESTQSGFTLGINTCLDHKDLTFRTESSHYKYKSNWDLNNDTLAEYEIKHICTEITHDKNPCNLPPAFQTYGSVATDLTVISIPSKPLKCKSKDVIIPDKIVFESMDLPIGETDVPPATPIILDETPSKSYRKNLAKLKHGKAEMSSSYTQTEDKDVGVAHVNRATQTLTKQDRIQESMKLWNVLPYKSPAKFVPSRRKRRRPLTRTARKLCQLHSIIDELTKIVKRREKHAQFGIDSRSVRCT